MKRASILRLALFLATAATLPFSSAATAQTLNATEATAMRTPESGFAPVNGLRMYYEIHGAGRPLILLHGGIAASEALGPNVEALARGRRVIVVHLQGHGHTRDIDRPLRAELMADDVAALIAHLGLGKADVMGYSMGGGVAMQTAIRHPEVVDRLVVVSEPMRRDGWYPEGLAAFDQLGANAAQYGESLKQSPLAAMYPEVDWEALFVKMGEMAAHDYDWSREVAAIRSPMMIVFADADGIRPEHIVEFYRLLGGGLRDGGIDGSGRPVARLAIVPGTTHYNLMETTMVSDLVIPFLDQPSGSPPPTPVGQNDESGADSPGADAEG